MVNLKTQIQIILCGATLGITTICACNNGPKQSSGSSDTSIIKKADNQVEKKINTSDTSKITFNSNDIPVTTKEIGVFPYLKAPEDYKFNDIIKSDLKTVHFSIHGELVAVEGKTFSTNIYKLQESATPFNMQIVQRNYDRVIAELGGVKVSEKLLPGQVEKVGKKILEDEGDHAYSIIGVDDYTLNHVNTYIIRTQKAEVWIELSFYENGGYIYILEKANQ